MDYYGTLRNEYIHKEMYPTEHRVDYFPKGPITGSVVKITPKANCIPRFVMKIEGNAVEEGERVFFEGIVDAQPAPIFSWYFNDDPIEPGRPGWDDVEIHDSKKMSTLILTYAREHHMGKYTLVAQNRMGHSACSCDLIVRKKQFPPVFWQRLYNYEATSGSKLIAEVEVGGWPIPEVFWFKDEEEVRTMVHTENYNGYPNKYVPERRVELRQIDPIRHCIIFHRISESDAGTYTVVARNPLGEAVCEAHFIVEPGDGGTSELYLPEKWKSGRRLNWAAEDDLRHKKFVGFQEPELTEEEIAEMTSRVSSVPLPRALEYLAGLPDYKPTPLQGLLPMNFKPESDVTSKREGRKGGKPSRPSRFVPGNIEHHGYRSDDPGPILPMWFNEFDPNARDPSGMRFQPVRYNYPPPRARPERPKSPPCPHEWESHDSINQLYKLLDTVGCRILLSDIRKDVILNASAAERQTSQQKSYLKKTAEARKHIIHYENKKQDEAIKAKQVQKFSYLNPSKSAPEQVDQPDSRSQNEEHPIPVEEESPEHPPALPPKTKIMFSPSRHLFSPTESLESNDTVQTVEYIPVKEKVKLIAQQQEELLRKEEMKRQTSGQVNEVVPPVGGIRILPPSPVTVRRAVVANDDVSVSGTGRHEEHSLSGQASSKSTNMMSSNHEHHTSHVTESNYVSSKEARQEEVTYVSQVTSQQSQVMSMAMTSSAQQMTSDGSQSMFIPRLEDKYGLETHLDELSSTIDSEESFISAQMTSRSFMTQSTSQAQWSNVQTTTSMASESSSEVTNKALTQMNFTSDGESHKAEESCVTRSGVTYESGSDQNFKVEANQDIQNQDQVSTSWQPRETFVSSYLGPAIAESPRPGLRKRAESSPRPTESESPKYRTPPSTPFQPGFYKKPAEEEPRTNPFPLPSPNLRKPRKKTRFQDEASDSEGEN